MTAPGAVVLSLDEIESLLMYGADVFSGSVPVLSLLQAGRYAASKNAAMSVVRCFMITSLR
jgi:hypothetical protein